jgi:hypothetical protein
VRQRPGFLRALREERNDQQRDVGAAPDEAALGVGEVPGGCEKRINWGKSSGEKLDGRTSIVQYWLAPLDQWPGVAAPPSHAWEGGALQSRAEVRSQRPRRGWTWMHGTQRSRLIR